MNLLAQGLEIQAQSVAKVVPLPTSLMWQHLRSQGKCIVHKPSHAEKNAEQARLLQEAIDNPPPEAA